MPHPLSGRIQQVGIVQRAMPHPLTATSGAEHAAAAVPLEWAREVRAWMEDAHNRGSDEMLG